MPKSDIWMKLYVGDYLADTQALSTEEHGAYLLLLMTYYRMGPLPNDARKLAQIVKASVRKWSTLAETIMTFFELAEDGLWHQKRADLEMSKSRLSGEIARDKAASAAKARWERDASSNNPSMLQASPENAPSIGEGCLEQCLSNASQSQSQSQSQIPASEADQKQVPSSEAKASKVKKAPDPRHLRSRNPSRSTSAT